MLSLTIKNNGMIVCISDKFTWCRTTDRGFDYGFETNDCVFMLTCTKCGCK